MITSRKKVTRSLVAATAIAATAALVLSGCSGEKKAAGDDEKIELRMLVNVTPNLTVPFWNLLVQQFENENPNIDVKIQSPTGGVAATLTTLLASGDVPDVVQSLAPSALLAPELTDLSKYKWAKEAPLADLYKIDGKYYMGNTGNQLQTTFFYNKQAFKDAGITAPPKTFEEFDEDLKKLKDAGWTPLQTGGDWYSKTLAIYLGMPTIIAEHPNYVKGVSDGSLKYSELFKPFIEKIEEWNDAGYFPKDAVGIKYPDAEAQFLAGKSAIYPMGAWFAAAEAKAAEKPEIGVFLGPALDGVKDAGVVGGASGPYLVLKGSKHQEAAAKLVEFLTTNKAALTAQLSTDGNFRDGITYESDDLGKELQELVSSKPASSWWAPAGDSAWPKSLAGIDGELNTQIQAIMTGKSAGDVLKDMDAWVDSNR